MFAIKPTDSIAFDSKYDAIYYNYNNSYNDVINKKINNTIHMLIKDSSNRLHDLAKYTDFQSGIKFELNITPSIYDNSIVLGVLWNIYEYLGGAHGNIALLSQNYFQKTGQILTLKDLFQQPDIALDIFTRISRESLISQGLPQDMVEAGTSSTLTSFEVFLVDEHGITLNFAPYQVGPWSEGIREVHIPLESLAPAMPNTMYWP